MSSIVVEEALRTMALKNIKRFYIEYFANMYNLELKEAATMLYEFSKKSNRLIIKYEVRCSKCINIIDEFDDISEIKLYEEVECDECGYINVIDSNNIYIIYYISDEYRKEIIELSKQNTTSRASRRGRRTLSTPSSTSINDLVKMGAIDISTDNQIINLTYCNAIQYINNGQAGAMGNNAMSTDFSML